MKRNNDPTADLPIGFSMALAQNGPAMTAFAGLDQAAREEIVARARAATSKAEMREIVANIGGNPPLV